MTTTEQIGAWLRKMQYSDPNPSEEALQTLCRGAMGPIFQQIIDRVKPKQEVEHYKKAIIVNTISTDKMKLTNMNQYHDGIEKLRLYNEKCKLEKQLQEINAQNIEKEASLEHLKAKIKTKNAKYQTNKDKLKEFEKDIVLYKAKKDNLEKQMDTCQKLHEQSKILETTDNIETDNLPNKMTEVLSKLYGITSSFNPQLSSGMGTPDLTTISENSTIGTLHTSVILSSNKKPLSSIKRSKRANSTRKNLTEITNNHSLLSSTLRKKNFSKISFMSSFNSSVSPTNSFIVDKNVEALKELEQICWNDPVVMKLIGELWQSGCENVFKILVELKEKHKNRITEMIAQDDNRNKDYNQKCVIGIEKLYAFHVETEMKRMICLQEQNKIETMLDSIDFTEDIREITVLKATDFSLQNAIEHAQNSVAKLKQEIPDNSEKLSQIFDEIQIVQTEMTSTKSKIETNLNILRECSSWMDKNQKIFLESIRKPQMYSEYELLKSAFVEQDARNFLSCPFQSQNTHYFDNWAKIYSNPELLEIIQYPFLSPENTVKFFFEQKTWLQQLKLLQKDANMDDEKLSKSLDLVNVVYDEKKIQTSYKKSVEQLRASAFTSSEILKRINDLNTELKYFLESPLNDCVAPKVKFENKTLKEYCELFDSYHKLLL